MEWQDDGRFAKNFYRGYTLNSDPEAAEHWFNELPDWQQDMLKYPNMVPQLVPSLITIQRRDKELNPEPVKIECAACGDTGVDEFNEPCSECQERPATPTGYIILMCGLLVAAVLAAVIFS